METEWVATAGLRANGGGSRGLLYAGAMEEAIHVQGMGDREEEYAYSVPLRTTPIDATAGEEIF